MSFAVRGEPVLEWPFRNAAVVAGEVSLWVLAV
jgi:hypothetical protein